jgi:hypothetical protein
MASVANEAWKAIDPFKNLDDYYRIIIYPIHNSPIFIFIFFPNSWQFFPIEGICPDWGNDNFHPFCNSRRKYPASISQWNR